MLASVALHAEADGLDVLQLGYVKRQQEGTRVAQWGKREKAQYLIHSEVHGCTTLSGSRGDVHAQRNERC